MNPPDRHALDRMFFIACALMFVVVIGVVAYTTGVVHGISASIPAPDDLDDKGA